MFWLYFARDFYRTAPNAHASTTATAAVASGVSPCEELAGPIESFEAMPRAAYAAKRQPSYVVRSAEITSASAHEPSMASPLAAYLQRLSIDGEHAFGVWDEDAGFSLFSANFDRITGLSSGECAGHDWIHAVHHTQQYALNQALLNAMAGTDGRCLVQARRMAEGSDIRWLMIDVKAATARQPSIMVLFRDLTEQKALEEALGQTEAALAMSERSRAAFLSSMSHELRTPLNAIMGFSEMMKSGVFGELGNKTYSEYAKHIHDSGATLLGKINDLLDIASMDAGGLELEESEFFLNQMLVEAMEMHSHHAFERQQQITLDCPLTLEIRADRAKILCATSHLISNALRHSKDSAEITLSVRIQHGDGVVVSVRDAGEGISATQLDTIRNALAAEVAYFNIESGGIGLGLSLTKELTERHGGRILIDSIRHRGTVVSLLLPTQRIISGLPKRKRQSHS